MASSVPQDDLEASPEVDLVKRAEYARKMHRRQMTRRGIIAFVVLSIVGAVTAVSMPVYHQVSTLWFLKSSGFRVDWQLDADNWLTGGLSSVSFSPRGFSTPRMLDQEMKELVKLWHLESLNLSECNVSESSLTALAGLVELKELNLTRMDQYRYGGPEGLSDNCLQPLQAMTRLETLTLSGNRITDEGLAMIAGLPKLEYLILDATDVTDAGLKHLEGMKNLKSVSLGATLVTPEGIKKLQRAIPGLEVDLHVDAQVERQVKNFREKRQ
jgi:hypothetical protein